MSERLRPEDAGFIPNPDCISCADKIVMPSGLTASASMFIVCPDCGNKRCPKASNHALECTDSNEPGQPGSYFPKFDPSTSGGAAHNDDPADS